MVRISHQAGESRTCPGCGEDYPQSMLACPKCKRLTHRDELQRLAAEASEAEKAERHGDALRAWRQALALLPPGAAQYQKVSDKCAYLSGLADVAESSPKGSAADADSGFNKSWLAGLGGVGLLLWKFKFVFAFVATKAKFLLAGLKQGGTIVSMALAFGVYWTIWGWAFAGGILLAIYVHEMGHVAALRRYGVQATAPMFIPGFGAFIRLKERLTSPREEARVGLAGPEWGLGATFFCYLVFQWTGEPIWGAIAKFSAWINLFNLLPVWQLDGAHALTALDKTQRWILIAVMAAMLFVTGEGLLILIALVAAMRSFGEVEAKPHWPILARFAVLVVFLSAFAVMDVPNPLEGGET